MKKVLLIFTLLSGSFFIIHAQDILNPDEVNKQEKIKALYVAYITQHLELNPEEAQKFWPVHTQFENELKSVNPNLPELERQQAVLNIKKRYHENFTKLLGARRSEDFFRMKGEFNKKLLERIRKQRQNQRNNPHNGFRRGL